MCAPLPCRPPCVVCHCRTRPTCTTLHLTSQRAEQRCVAGRGSLQGKAAEPFPLAQGLDRPRLPSTAPALCPRTYASSSADTQPRMYRHCPAREPAWSDALCAPCRWTPSGTCAALCSSCPVLLCDPGRTIRIFCVVNTAFQRRSVHGEALESRVRWLYAWLWTAPLGVGPRGSLHPLLAELLTRPRRCVCVFSGLGAVERSRRGRSDAVRGRR